MASNYAFKYKVDIVFCIDATMSMYNILDKVKAGVINFHADLLAAMEKKNKRVDSLRVRLVVFRDYVADGNDAMQVTNFFELPAQSAEFAACVRSIVPKGGGDDPEDALEALAYAIRSPWIENDSAGSKRRQIVALWTDAPPHPLGFGARERNYPAGMPKTLEELSGWWGTKQAPGFMEENAKRLLLYAPECDGWNKVSNNWSNSVYFPSIAGEGLKEFEYEQIIDVIAGSV